MKVDVNSLKARFRARSVLAVTLRSSSISLMLVREENGTVQRITMSNIDLRATPPANSFRVDLPAGVQVVRP